MSFSRVAPLLVYTDAAGSGHFGSVLLRVRTEYRPNCHLLGMFARSETQIGEYEDDACVLEFAFLPLSFRGAQYFCDVVTRGEGRANTWI